MASGEERSPDAAREAVTQAAIELHEREAALANLDAQRAALSRDVEKARARLDAVIAQIAAGKAVQVAPRKKVGHRPRREKTGRLRSLPRAPSAQEMAIVELLKKRPTADYDDVTATLYGERTPDTYAAARALMSKLRGRAVLDGEPGAWRLLAPSSRTP